MTDAEVPETDAIEQHRHADPDVADDGLPRDIAAEVPEADALEQSREVPIDDDTR